eukprot:INCI1823.1.p1 GENE.INCI1823.1~~INCI1823.1.p1  ORF type:complete len:236 (-),score=38.13 INCI1823.1:992-1699(-)
MCDSSNNTSGANCSTLLQNSSTEWPAAGTPSTNEIALPLLQLELAVAGLLLVALLVQCWRLRRYKHHAVVKKLQLRHFRKHNLHKEARKFFGNLSVREKIFLTDDVPAKQTIIQVELPLSDIMRPTKIVCRYVELSDSFQINSADYFRNKVLTVDLHPKGRAGDFFCRIPIGDQRSYIHIKSLDIFELTTNKYWTVDSEGHGWAFIKIQHDMLFSDWVLARPGEIDLARDTPKIK